MLFLVSSNAIRYQARINATKVKQIVLKSLKEERFSTRRQLIIPFIFFLK